MGGPGSSGGPRIRNRCPSGVTSYKVSNQSDWLPCFGLDTDMERDYPPPKMPPRDVADAALAALERGLEEVYPGDMAQGVSQGLAADPKAVEKQFAAYLPG